MKIQNEQEFCAHLGADTPAQASRNEQNGEGDAPDIGEDFRHLGPERML